MAEHAVMPAAKYLLLLSSTNFPDFYWLVFSITQRVFNRNFVNFRKSAKISDLIPIFGPFARTALGLARPFRHDKQVPRILAPQGKGLTPATQGRPAESDHF